MRRIRSISLIRSLKFSTTVYAISDYDPVFYSFGGWTVPILGGEPEEEQILPRRTLSAVLFVPPPRMLDGHPQERFLAQSAPPFSKVYKENSLKKVVKTSLQRYGRHRLDVEALPQRVPRSVNVRTKLCATIPICLSKLFF